MFFELFDEDTAGVRPGVLAGPRPQKQVQRHTVEHIVDFVRFAPMVQILDAPVPQMVEQLPNILHFFNKLMPDPEQVIEVPKILPDDVPVRTAVRDTQLAEQLVEVPTIVSFSLLQQIMEQNVGITVLGLGGRFAGLQGFPLEQSSTAPSAQIVHIPVQVEVFEVFAQGKVHLLLTFQLVFMKTWISLVYGVFRTFPPSKKSAASAAQTSPRVHASVSSSTPATQLHLFNRVMVLTSEGPCCWDRCTGETRWKMEDGYLPSWWLRPMAAVSVLGTRMFSRRLTTCDVVLGTSL